jgi:hypothetical protein
MTIYRKESSLKGISDISETFLAEGSEMTQLLHSTTYYKNANSSLENQVLSDASVQSVKEKLLAKWNDSYLTAEEREKVRRAGVLLKIDFDKSTEQLLEAKAVVLNTPIRQQSDEMHRLWGKRKGA